MLRPPQFRFRQGKSNDDAIDKVAYKCYQLELLKSWLKRLFVIFAKLWIQQVTQISKLNLIIFTIICNK